MSQYNDAAQHHQRRRTLAKSPPGPTQPTPSRFPVPQQYPQYSHQQPLYSPPATPTWTPQPQVAVTQSQSQMHYSQFQQPSYPGHGRSQSQQVYQHQYQSTGAPQVDARPPLSQQYTPPGQGPFSSPRNGERNRTTSNPNRVMSKEEDIERLFHVCKSGRGNANLLHEALVFAKPEDLKEKGLIQEFLGRCRSSQDLIFSQINWASAQAEQSRRKASSSKETQEEKLLAELLGANEELLEAIKMYTDLERVGIEQGALERAKAEQKLRALTAITSFKPTRAESAMVDQIFDMADTRGIGSISSQAAVKIFSGANVSPGTLADIWRIANVEEGETLSREVVGVAVRLIGHAQKGKGKNVEEAWVETPGPLAVIEGLEPTGHHNGPVAGPSNSGLPSINNLPPLTSEDRTKFMRIFNGSAPSNGVLEAGRARGVLLKSRLPLQTLAQIWELADVQQQGYLDATSFIVAMYLIQATMSGKIKTMPASLPSSIYFDASPMANGFTPPTMTSPLSPISSSFLHRSAGPSAASSSRTPLWDVSNEEKETADEFFNVLDEQQKGYLEGKVARAHFLQSGLPERDVKQIWSLVDINKDGRLGRDEFAVALHLIQARQNGSPLPQTLPDGLIPPSSRRPASTQEESLIDLVDSAPLPSIPPLQPTPTGFTSPISPISVSITGPGRSNLLAGLPSTSGQLLTPPLSPTNRNGVVSEPSSRPPTSHLPFPPLSASGSISQPHLPPLPPKPVELAPSAGPSAPPGLWTWVVTPAEKASSDQYFDMLDPWKHGYIEGEAAVPFMSKSKLPEAVLAKIWDLADSDTDGRLSKDDFAIAMHLIKASLAGNEVPNTLPPSLIPQSSPVRVMMPVPEASPFEDPIPGPTSAPAHLTTDAAPAASTLPAAPSTAPTAASPAAQERRNSEDERPLPAAPPGLDPAPSLPPDFDELPRSQTPPPPYALVDAEGTVEAT
ncbi:hypothetical protein EIP91_011306 [Steccherinum ochraceum]|uniref:Uncharacterized protein n=1 Tax=Steccherinum ochraceum TaxID=92696 RepID=A0A4V2MX01_9APHY|nr:hypothetical protein EIP91_011306 [Steccherinum ochraceum]